ncbi:MAG: cache domain-containing protein, partial [Ardenticatenales bacterium]|nr:cache domain-containing protein [Ardenticatenales bacterium]
MGFYILILTGFILVPALLFVESSIADALVSQKIAEIEKIDQNVVRQLSAQIETAESSIQRFAQLLSTSIDPPDPTYISDFDRAVHLDEDGAWRSDRTTYQPDLEAGIWVPRIGLLNDDLKSFYIQAKGITEQYGSGALNPTFVNTWILPDSNGEVIFWPNSPDFVYLAGADHDYTQTDWVNLVRPEVNPQGEATWTPTSFDPVPAIWIISVIAPYTYQGEWAGSVGHDVTVSNLLSYSGELSQVEGSRFLIFAPDGTMLLSDRYQPDIEESGGTFKIQESNEPELIPVIPSLLEQVEQSTPGDVIRMETESDFLIASRVEGPGWIVVNAIPRASIIELIRQPFSILRWIVLLSVGVMLFASVVSISREGIRRREREQEIRDRNSELERRVVERTTQLSQRAEQLQLINHVGRSATSVLDQRVLLPEIAKRIQERFDYYAVMILLLDEQAKVVRLNAVATEKAEALLEKGFSLALGQGIIGHVAKTGEPLV